MSPTPIRCPYCAREMEIDQYDDYAPKRHTCAACGQTFVVERAAHGFMVMKEQDVSCMDDPDCREVEMGGSCEE